MNRRIRPGRKPALHYRVPADCHPLLRARGQRSLQHVQHLDVSHTARAMFCRVSRSTCNVLPCLTQHVQCPAVSHAARAMFCRVSRSTCNVLPSLTLHDPRAVVAGGSRWLKKAPAVWTGEVFCRSYAFSCLGPVLRYIGCFFRTSAEPYSSRCHFCLRSHRSRVCSFVIIASRLSLALSPSPAAVE